MVKVQYYETVFSPRAEIIFLERLFGAQEAQGLTSIVLAALLSRHERRREAALAKLAQKNYGDIVVIDEGKFNRVFIYSPSGTYLLHLTSYTHSAPVLEEEPTAEDRVLWEELLT